MVPSAPPPPVIPVSVAGAVVSAVAVVSVVALSDFEHAARIAAAIPPPLNARNLRLPIGARKPLSCSIFSFIYLSLFWFMFYFYD